MARDLRRAMSTAAAWTVMSVGLGVAAALSAPSASADPVAEPGPPAPVPVPAAPATPDAAPLGAPAPAPAGPAEVPHLLSPENLPPGTSATPVAPSGSRGLSYIRDLWHAVRTQEVSGGDALFLLTQRPLDPNATPPAGLPAGPQAPLPPTAEVAPAAAPVPAP
ncbi:hypothetical protein ACN27E_04365 [Mycobacterium sp. WMMD1722]|uniref:hypothetical protein n=1 Tax=Mycobacterium sp. WMMD1722 TaxID=3404117 RepID=UPI003BF605F0